MKEVRVTQKAIIFNEEGKFLIMRRTGTAPASPNKWDFPGGELDFGEDTTNGIVREIREECELDVNDIKLFDIESHINEKGDFWVTVAYTARARSNEIKLSFEHNKFRWVSAEDFLKLESLGKLRRFAKKLISNKF